MSAGDLKDDIAERKRHALEMFEEFRTRTPPSHFETLVGEASDAEREYALESVNLDSRAVINRVRSYLLHKDDHEQPALEMAAGEQSPPASLPKIKDPSGRTA